MCHISFSLHFSLSSVAQWQCLWPTGMRHLSEKWNKVMIIVIRICPGSHFPPHLSPGDWITRPHDRMVTKTTVETRCEGGATLYCSCESNFFDISVDYIQEYLCSLFVRGSSVPRSRLQSVPPRPPTSPTRNPKPVLYVMFVWFCTRFEWFCLENCSSPNATVSNGTLPMPCYPNAVAFQFPERLLYFCTRLNLDQSFMPYLQLCTRYK